MKVQIASLIAAVVVFVAQKLIFRYCSHTFVRFIPLICIGCVYLVAVGLIISDRNISGGVAMRTLFGFVIAGVDTAALIADGIAWLIEKV